MLDILRNGLRSDVVRRGAFGVAFVVFLAGIILSVRAQPEAIENLRLLPMLVVLCGVMPVILLLNGREFQLSVRLLDKELSYADAMGTTVMGSAANMLPLPGSAMVKIARMRVLGIDLAAGSFLTMVLAFLWLGCSFLYGGVWLYVLTKTQWSGLVPLAGFLLLCGVVFLGGKTHGHFLVLLEILVVRMLLVFVDACALYFCFQSLALTGNFAQASVLTVSGVLGAAVSIVPAGFGVREVAAAGLAELITMSAASAYLAASLYRIVGLFAILPLSLFFMHKYSRKKPG